jgi:hypothetical protein
MQAQLEAKAEDPAVIAMRLIASSFFTLSFSFR